MLVRLLVFLVLELYKELVLLKKMRLSRKENKQISDRIGQTLPSIDTEFRTVCAKSQSYRPDERKEKMAAVAFSSATTGICSAAAKRAPDPRAAAPTVSRHSHVTSQHAAGSLSSLRRVVGARRGAHVMTFAGSDAPPTDAVSEVANMDSLIDLLVAADEEALVKLVAENVLSFDQKMWIRIASRSDAAESQEDKDNLMAMAGKCMKLVEAMVEQTENTIQESSKLLETIVAQAADPDTGEFDVPLQQASVERLRKAVDGAVVDERMLNTVYAWIRKSDEDKMDGMVHILQILLQCYAARELDTGATPLDEVIGAAADEWPKKFDEVIKGGFSEEAFVRDLQKRMEGVVLNLPNGSYAQRVQAEYLKEVEDRGKSLYAAMEE